MKPLATFIGAALVGALALLAAPTAQAQVGVNINFGAPNWGPRVPYGTQYYYIPEIDGYYDLYAQQYLVYDDGYWVPLPQLYGYDPYRFHPVVIAYRGREPWCQRDYYHRRYAYQPYCNYGRGGYGNGYYGNGYGRNNYPRGGYYGGRRGYNDHDDRDYGNSGRGYGYGGGYGGGYGNAPRGGQSQYPGNGDNGGPRGGSYGGPPPQPQSPLPGSYGNGQAHDGSGNGQGNYGGGQAHGSSGNGQSTNGQGNNAPAQEGGRHGRD